jgi:hypothetical protein
VSENLKNGLFRGEIFYSRNKNHLSEGPFFKNDKMCNSYESRSVSARAECYKKVRKQILKKNFLPPHVFWDPGSGMGKNPDPGSGINIPDPQHCLPVLFFFGRRLW